MDIVGQVGEAYSQFGRWLNQATNRIGLFPYRQVIEFRNGESYRRKDFVLETQLEEHLFRRLFKGHKVEYSENGTWKDYRFRMKGNYNRLVFVSTGYRCIGESKKDVRYL